MSLFLPPREMNPTPRGYCFILTINLHFTVMKGQRIDKSTLMFDNTFLWNLIAPLLIEVLLAVTIGIADTVMVASVGEHAVSGVSLVDAVSNLFIFLLQAFASGGAVVTSQYLGKREPDNASFAAKQLMYLSLLFSVAITALLLLFREPLVSLVYGSIEPDVRSSAMDYYLPIVLSYPFFALFSNCTALFRSMGKSRITMYVSLVMNIINISGNAFCIYILHLGAAGAGIASLFSRIAGVLFLFPRLLNKSEAIHIEKPLKPELSLSMLYRILRIALPSGIENSIFHFGKILVASTVASFGTISIAASAVVNSLGMFANIPGNAISQASVTVIGQCCGAREYGQAAYYGKKLLLIAHIVTGVTSLIMFISCPFLIGLYQLSPGAFSLSLLILRLHVVQLVLFWPEGFIITSFLRAAGDVKYPMCVSIASMWLFRVLLSKVLGVYFGFGLLGVFWGMYIDWYCRCIFYIHRFVKGKWKKMTVV